MASGEFMHVNGPNALQERGDNAAAKVPPPVPSSLQDILTTIAANKSPPPQRLRLGKSRVRELLLRLRHKVFPEDRANVLEFLPAAREITATPPSPVRITIVMVICGLFILAIGAAWLGRVDIHAIAPGRVQPAGQSKLVQPFYSGSIRAVRVKEGSVVQAGSVLVELDPTEALAEHDTAAIQVDTLNAEISRRKAAIAAVQAGDFTKLPSIVFLAGTDPSLQSRETALLTADLSNLAAGLGLLDARIAETSAQRDALGASAASTARIITLAQERQQMWENLQRHGAGTKASLLDVTENLERAKVSRIEQEGRFNQAVAGIATLEQQKAQTTAQFLAEYAQGLQKAEMQRDATLQNLKKTSARLQYTQLTAPIAGTVQQLEVTTIGQVVSAGQQLMTIVPQNAKLEMQALVQNKDIGFVHVGQKVVIKIDAFNFTRYGTVSGTITSVSKDSVHSAEAQAMADTQKAASQQKGGPAALPETMSLVYPVMIALDESSMMIDGVKTPLTPGMNATAEIKTGQRRVIEYILSPFQKAASEAIRER